MMYFRVSIVGYDTCEFNDTYRTLFVEAENEDDANAKGKKWCEEHSYMGGNEWYLNSGFSVVTKEEYEKADFKA